jgi:hypothetical protein
MYIYDHISLSYFRKKSDSNKFREKSNKFHVQTLFFFENRAVYEIMWKNPS